MLTKLRNAAILTIVVLSLLLNYGFMAASIPGLHLPLAECVLALALILTWIPGVIIKSSRVFSVGIFLFWFCFCAMRAVAGLPEYGLWALRDSCQVWDSVALIVGFAFAAKYSNIDAMFKWLPKFFAVGLIYAATYPVAKTLQALSPKISSASGGSAALLFNYQTTGIVVLLAAVYLLIHEDNGVLAPYRSVFAGILICYTVFLFQARTVYVEVIAIFACLLALQSHHRIKIIRGLMATLIVGALVLGFLSVSGIQIQGRLGEDVSSDFLFNHLMAITGSATSSSTAASAGGVAQRQEWWRVVFYKLNASMGNTLFGLGYGMPLTNFYANGVVVREVHNSYVSMIGRVGLIGMGAWVVLQGFLLRTWYKGWRLAKLLNLKDAQKHLLLLLLYFVMVGVFAIAEDAFEKTYNCIPYYFGWGVVLAYTYHLTRLRTDILLDEQMNREAAE